MMDRPNQNSRTAFIYAALSQSHRADGRCLSQTTGFKPSRRFGPRVEVSASAMEPSNARSEKMICDYSAAKVTSLWEERVVSLNQDRRRTLVMRQTNRRIDDVSFVGNGDVV
jgi:hypothetical protein